MKYKTKLLPTKKQLGLYVLLRKKGFSPKMSDELMKNPSLARRLLKR